MLFSSREGSLQTLVRQIELSLMAFIQPWLELIWDKTAALEGFIYLWFALPCQSVPLQESQYQNLF